MKNCLVLIALLLPFYLKAQSKEVDTISIVFKAKLFTISNHGYNEKNTLINNIENIPYSTYGNNEFLFIKIKSRYFCFDLKDEKSYARTIWCDCDYYVCYSVKKDVYYLLGGFKNDNIEEFSREYYGSLFSTAWDYKLEDKSLSEFIKYINLGKLKKAKKCFDKCTETWN
ncbi:hypothetical protein GOQ30_09915 [Flavobacterium sp. TP390]|uniref:DUF4468 domain-containing protein n=1 Tax=Flavobacterium profundi TaxID=1774945 RepID=A0A6I4ILV1_9FLAO|nr:hypothetical protein [Flavobacterium profundi]MVO09472.1 hypothetical protein [Flavobacterium profundi]